MTITKMTAATSFLVATAVILMIVVGLGVVDGNFQFGQEGKFCKPYKCRKADQVPVPKLPLKFESPGCSGSKFANLVARGFILSIV